MSTLPDKACVHNSQPTVESLTCVSSQELRTRQITHDPLSARQIIDWIESNGTQILIQRIPPGKRRKNRVILGFRRADGELRAVGGSPSWRPWSAR